MNHMVSPETGGENGAVSSVDYARMFAGQMEQAPTVKDYVVADANLVMACCVHLFESHRSLGAKGQSTYLVAMSPSQSPFFKQETNQEWCSRALLLARSISPVEPTPPQTMLSRLNQGEVGYANIDKIIETHPLRTSLETIVASNRYIPILRTKAAEMDRAA